jgi:CRISPR system Cascade subunit CasA
MAYNLIDERWIPVERQSGKVELVAPAEIADRADPPLRIASPRPDFDGALLEFLIGLLQTAAAPATERAWEREFESPPGVRALRKRFDAVRDAFFLDGDGPRFMQDLTVAKDPKAATEPIGALLIDRIGESGLEEAPTLFAKPGLYPELGYPAAATALMALQTYAPAGGRGQLTSLRGGGPLTTVILGGSVWETVWLNVLPRGEFEQRVPGDSESEDAGAVFPWMAKTRTSATKGGKSTPPQKVHPLQHLWGLPRRFRLVIDPETCGTCAASGTPGVPTVRAYLSRPDGTSYDGGYRHPLTPYSLTKPGEPWNPKKASSEGLPYRDWPLLVATSEKRAPATVVTYFAQTRRRELLAHPRLAAFGYAMDNMKPLRWIRAETPLVTVPPAHATSFAGELDALVAASEEVRKTLCFQIKSAWSDRPGDLDVLGRVNPAFWSRTEPAFFRSVHAIAQLLDGEAAAAARDAVREGWLAELHVAALGLFDTFVNASAALAPTDLRRAVQARHHLDQFTRPTVPKLRKLLNLPVAENVAVPKGSKNPRSKKARASTKESQ